MRSPPLSQQFYWWSRCSPVLRQPTAPPASIRRRFCANSEGYWRELDEPGRTDVGQAVLLAPRLGSRLGATRPARPKRKQALRPRRKSLILAAIAGRDRQAWGYVMRT